MTQPARHNRNRLRDLVRAHYDLQDMRLRFEGRVNAASSTTLDGKEKKSPRPALHPDDVKLFDKWKSGLESFEEEALAIIKGELKSDPVWKGFLEGIPGVGPTMGAVLLGGGFNIELEDTPSKMISYAGLAPGQKRVRGQKTNYNPWMRTKIAGVMADCILKACVRKVVQDKPEWRRVEYPWMDSPRWIKSYARAYFDYRNRKESMRVECMTCDGTGEAKAEDLDPAAPELSVEDPAPRKRRGTPGKTKAPKATKKCTNCDGTAVGPWGRSDAHRHRAAVRYFVKLLLIDFWRFWRAAEGLPVRDTYAVEKLGHAPHSNRPLYDVG